MATETREAQGHTTHEGTLNLSVNVGIADADVAVPVRSLSERGPVDGNGWPVGFFERVVGSMPDLEWAPQGQFEDRPALG